MAVFQQTMGKSYGCQPPTPFDLQQALEHFERGYLQNVLQLTQWDMGEAARLLGISQESLAQKITQYHLQHKAVR